MTKDDILLVEDDQALLAGMHDFLKLSGYSVQTAEHGAAALALLDEDNYLPDLIVSDIMMPEIDGYELLAALRRREEWVSIPFIFLTAKSTLQDIRSGKQLGADEYITKPFDVKDLLIAIEARLSRHAELQKMNDTRLTGMKRRILTTLNHEFRTPLSYVIAYSDMIINGEEELNPQELHDFLVGIHTGGERLMRLVENFLLLAEMETGQAVKTYELRRETIPNLQGLVTDMVESLRAEADRCGIDLRYDAPASVPAIQGDFQYLKSAIVHLIENGIKFTRDVGSTVEVVVDESDEYVTLAVHDDGIGVAADQHEHLFESFYQANRDQMQQSGLGAGLSIVKHVAALHAGHIEVDSELGRGATFVLSLPIHPIG